MRSLSHRTLPRRPAALAMLVTLVVIGALAFSAPAFAALPVSSVSDQLTCQCGCNSVLTECPHQDCGWGVPAKQYIGQELETGTAPEEIIAYFVAQNGEQVLAAPTKSGINLIAWVLPFVALAVGGVAVYYLVIGWARKRSEPGLSAAEGLSASAAPSEASRRLDEELRDFD